jgi:hypothetical protein
MDTSQTQIPDHDRTDVKPLTQRQFRLARDLTDEELGQVRRLVPADEVDFFHQYLFEKGITQYVRFQYWYNLPFSHQTLLELILPCR